VSDYDIHLDDSCTAILMVEAAGVQPTGA